LVSGWSRKKAVAALRARRVISRGRRVDDAEQQADHQVAPEQSGELLGHVRRTAAEQSAGLGLGHDRRQGGAAGLVPEGMQRAGNSYSVIGQVLTVREVVAALARGLGREVAYQDVDDEVWAEAASSRINTHAVAHLSKLWAAFRTRPRQFEVTDTIERLGGRKPKTFAEFVAEEKLTFPA
jgi:hypothetical protein